LRLGCGPQMTVRLSAPVPVALERCRHGDHAASPITSTPRLLPAMAAMLASGHYDVALASRIFGRGAIEGGISVYKYIANRV